jgi:hypothetical protein
VAGFSARRQEREGRGSYRLEGLAIEGRGSGGVLSIVICEGREERVASSEERVDGEKLKVENCKLKVEGLESRRNERRYLGKALTAGTVGKTERRYRGKPRPAGTDLSTKDERARKRQGKKTRKREGEDKGKTERRYRGKGRWAGGMYALPAGTVGKTERRYRPTKTGVCRENNDNTKKAGASKTRNTENPRGDDNTKKAFPLKSATRERGRSRLADKKRDGFFAGIPWRESQGKAKGKPRESQGKAKGKPRDPARGTRSKELQATRRGKEVQSRSNNIRATAKYIQTRRSQSNKKTRRRENATTRKRDDEAQAMRKQKKGYSTRKIC